MSCDFPSYEELFQMIGACGPFANRGDVINALNRFSICCLAEIEDGEDPEITPSIGLNAFGGEISCDIAAIHNQLNQVWLTFDRGVSWRQVGRNPVGALVSQDVDIPNEIPAALFEAFPNGLPPGYKPSWVINQRWPFWDGGAEPRISPGDIFATFDEGETMHYIAGKETYINGGDFLYGSQSESSNPLPPSIETAQSGVLAMVPFSSTGKNYVWSTASKWPSIPSYIGDISPPYKAEVLLNVTVRIAANGTGTRILLVSRGNVIGGAYPSSFFIVNRAISLGSAATETVLQLTIPMEVNANQVYRMRVLQNSGVALGFNYASSITILNRIGLG